jgi:hypothetical protein
MCYAAPRMPHQGRMYSKLNKKIRADSSKIYSGRTQSEARRNQQLPPTEPQVSSPPPVIGIQKVAPVQKVQHIPDITPMRRGRPTAPAQAPPGAKPSASPMRGTTSDPFAALDSQDVQVRRAAADELAARFPSLDEFSLLHDRGQKFEFNQPSPSGAPLNKRVTEALADDAFALPPASRVDSAPGTKPSSMAPSTTVSRTASIKKPKPYEASEALVHQAQRYISQYRSTVRWCLLVCRHRLRHPQGLRRTQTSLSDLSGKFRCLAITTGPRASHGHLRRRRVAHL